MQACQDTQSQVDIRMARIEDIPQAINLFQEFKKESLAEYGYELDPEYFANICKNLLNTSMVLAIGDSIQGVITTTIFSSPMNGDKIAQELVWFVSLRYRKYGVRLLKEMEAKCKEWGCKQLIMAYMSNSRAERLERFYTHCGYRLLEVHYVKNLGGIK